MSYFEQIWAFSLFGDHSYDVTAFDNVTFQTENIWIRVLDKKPFRLMYNMAYFKQTLFFFIFLGYPGRPGPKRGDISICSSGKPCAFFLVVLDTLRNVFLKSQLYEYFFPKTPVLNFHAPTIRYCKTIVDEYCKDSGSYLQKLRIWKNQES